MDEVGPLETDDLRVGLDRRTAHYEDALTLARSILTGVSRDLEVGDARAWTFLLRTPEMVELGLRRLLARNLAPRWKVEKKGLQLSASSLTLNPDLVFEGGAAVGDVKYKLAASEWRRSDLYQVVAFATGFRAASCLMLDFSRELRAELPSLQVGEVHVSHVSWPALEEVAAAEAADETGRKVSRWLDERLA
jgi:5-methylcytosine-specific restriction endonuclease McrBC regulatory subunit McrC